MLAQAECLADCGGLGCSVSVCLRGLVVCGGLAAVGVFGVFGECGELFAVVQL